VIESTYQEYFGGGFKGPSIYDVHKKSGF